MCSDQHLPRPEIVAILAGLLDKSVIVRIEHTRAWTPAIACCRAYGLKRLADSRQEEVFRTRHRDYFRDLAVRYEAECFGPQQVEWLLHMRREHANLRTAIGFCLDSGDGRTRRRWLGRPTTGSHRGTYERV